MLTRTLLASLTALLSLALAGCGDKIGDACTVSSDCSPTGERLCDTVNAPDGYCTIVGCDNGTCPEEAVCIRFFSNVINDGAGCDPRTEDRLSGGTDDCIPDDVCTLSGICVPATAESRFCMLKCDKNSDCRDGYECRDESLMVVHGGEPVPEPGEALGDDLQSFCAVTDPG